MHQIRAEGPRFRAPPGRTVGPVRERREAKVELENVARRYEVGGGTLTALEDATVTIAPGEFCVVLGPSGSGKTTMLNMIGALDTPTEGRVTIGGQEITSASRKELFRFRREMVSFVFQTFNLFPSLTALENVECGVDIGGHFEDSRARASETLDAVGLGERLDHFPHQLSGGEQQRVAIARALATGNPVLLADEPTGELDFHTGVQILQLLHAQADAGSTVIVVTHNREIARVGDRVIELSSGRIVRDGPPEGGQARIEDLHW